MVTIRQGETPVAGTVQTGFGYDGLIYEVRTDENKRNDEERNSGSAWKCVGNRAPARNRRSIEISSRS